MQRNIIRLFPWELLTNSCVPIRGTFANWFTKIRKVLVETEVQANHQK
jgi:hypothetical protein